VQYATWRNEMIRHQRGLEAGHDFRALTGRFDYQERD
jgi:hypothetical protein